MHIASAAGVWQSLVFGFGGVRDHEGELSIAPRLPSMWTRLEFSLRVRQRQLRISLTHDEERYVLDDGDPLQVRIRASTRVLECDHPLVLGRGDIAPPIR